jgi:hypothetical protein
MYRQEGTRSVDTIKTGYRGLSLLIDLNWDRFMSVGALLVGLLVGAWIISVISYLPLVDHI